MFLFEEMDSTTVLSILPKMIDIGSRKDFLVLGWFLNIFLLIWAHGRVYLGCDSTNATNCIVSYLTSFFIHHLYGFTSKLVYPKHIHCL